MQMLKEVEWERAVASGALPAGRHFTEVGWQLVTWEPPTPPPAPAPLLEPYQAQLAGVFPLEPVHGYPPGVAPLMPWDEGWLGPTWEALARRGHEAKDKRPPTHFQVRLLVGISCFNTAYICNSVVCVQPRVPWPWQVSSTTQVAPIWHRSLLLVCVVCLVAYCSSDGLRCSNVSLLLKRAAKMGSLT